MLLSLVCFCVQDIFLVTTFVSDWKFQQTRQPANQFNTHASHYGVIKSASYQYLITHLTAPPLISQVKHEHTDEDVGQLIGKIFARQSE